MDRPSAPVHIAVSKSSGIRIDWQDGLHSEYPLAYLRDRCPCASCTGAHGAPPRKTDYSAPAQPVTDSPFQMYKPALRINRVSPVGNYALQIHWNDGHDTGIYTWDYLRSISPGSSAVTEGGS